VNSTETFSEFSTRRQQSEAFVRVLLGKMSSAVLNEMLQEKKLVASFFHYEPE
jgi:hypothetical protein